MCESCPHLRNHEPNSGWFCSRAIRNIKNIEEGIPEWCPLPDEKQSDGATKHIEGMGVLSLTYDDFWTICESQDCQTYDDYDCAKSAYDSIVDIPSLVKEFGWKEHPYELT